MSAFGEFLSEFARTLTRPSQGRFGGTAGHRFDQRLQGSYEVRIRVGQTITTAATTANALCFHLTRAFRQLQFTKTSGNSRTRQLSCPRNQRNAPITQVAGFTGRPLTTTSLTQLRSQGLVFSTNPCDSCCIHDVANVASSVDLRQYLLVKVISEQSLRQVLAPRESRFLVYTVLDGR